MRKSYWNLNAYQNPCIGTFASRCTLCATENYACPESYDDAVSSNLPQDQTGRDNLSEKWGRRLPEVKRTYSISGETGFDRAGRAYEDCRAIAEPAPRLTTMALGRDTSPRGQGPSKAYIYLIYVLLYPWAMLSFS